jgi:undecaprenyl-diphosphatase
MNELLTAAVIGVVEGLTEFLPVSSTGHIIIVGHMLGFSGNAASVFEVAIQFGAILSVLYLYRDKFRRFLRKEGFDRRRGLSVWHIAAGIIPVMAAAFFLHGYIKKYLFSPYTVAVGLLAGGLLLLAAERRAAEKAVDSVDDITVKQALAVGLFQLLSLWPGFSRSGVTIAGGLFFNLTRRAAAEFSFIIAVPVMLAACLYDLYKNAALLDERLLVMLSVGFGAAFVTAFLSVRWFVKFLNRSSLCGFALYRFFLAAFAFWYFA